MKMDSSWENLKVTYCDYSMEKSKGSRIQRSSVTGMSKAMSMVNSMDLTRGKNSEMTLLASELPH